MMFTTEAYVQKPQENALPFLKEKMIKYTETEFFSYKDKLVHYLYH